MTYFSRLDELAIAANSRGLFEGMLVYCDRENARDLEFANGPLAVQCAEYLKQLSKSEVLRMLELRKTIAEVHIQVHKKIDSLPFLCFVDQLLVDGDDG
ncbi:hypothetical protein Tco_0795675 [Tanacetum coccineum]